MKKTKPKHDKAAKAGEERTNAEQAAERAEADRKEGGEQFQAENTRLKEELRRPALHEAVGSVDSDEQESGVVLDELRRGYRWAEELLRPARVRVAR
ncbi:MAG: nucleotide exchange factor GrpE [Blastocatellia bacterium]